LQRLTKNNQSQNRPPDLLDSLLQLVSILQLILVLFLQKLIDGYMENKNMPASRHYTFTINNIIKNHCNCGNKLKRKKIAKVLYPNDKDFTRPFLRPDVTEDIYITYGFYCEKCNKLFTDDEVTKLRRLQKKFGTKVLSDQEIESIFDVKKQ